MVKKIFKKLTTKYGHFSPLIFLIAFLNIHKDFVILFVQSVPITIIRLPSSRVVDKLVHSGAEHVGCVGGAIGREQHIV